MSELKIEVGKKYNCRGGHIAEIEDYDSTEHYCFTGRVYYKNGNTGAYSWTKQGKFMGFSSKENLDLISEHIEDMQLVVGEKYNIEEHSYNPYMFIGDLREHNYETDSPLIFINNMSIPLSRSLNQIKGKIKKHIEKPQPYEVVVYASYDPSTPQRCGFLDHCTDLYSRTFSKDYRQIKDHAKKYNEKVAKITAKIEPDYQGE